MPEPNAPARAPANGGGADAEDSPMRRVWGIVQVCASRLPHPARAELLPSAVRLADSACTCSPSSPAAASRHDLCRRTNRYAAAVLRPAARPVFHVC